MASLDYDYIWDRLQELCNVIYDAYDEDDIPKGRSFGSKGEDYTVNEILIPKMNAMGLEDVDTEQIKHIVGKDKYYTSIINKSDFSITINNASDVTYPFPNPVPKEEVGLIASGYIPRTINHSLTDVEIIVHNMTALWPFGGLFSEYHLNVTDYDTLNCILPFIVGNVTYIEAGEQIPEDQYGQVFLLDDVDGCQDKLDNISFGQASIIIDSGSKGLDHANASKADVSVVSIDGSDGQTIKELCENYTVVFADNVTGNLTLTYNLNQGFSCNKDFVFIDRIPNRFELLEESTVLYNLVLSLGIYPDQRAYNTCTFAKAFFWYFWNCISPIYDCKGFVLYDTFDQHYNLETVIKWNKEFSIVDWIRELLEEIYDEGLAKTMLARLLTQLKSIIGMGPGVPIFTLNNSVGKFLKNNYDTTTVTGYLEQEFLEETQSTPAIIAHNVVGNITIDESPNDAIAIISNRYDGMWGQTPGDSGAGGAIVLGIAKYMSDNNIKPKYNVTFLFTTGEEYGFRGAWYYNDSHPNDNIKYWFGLDQLCMDQYDAELCIYHRNSNHGVIINATRDLTQYYSRTGYENLTFHGNGAGSEQGVYSTRANCDTFMFVKPEHYDWEQWHRAGVDYTEGDSLKYIDRNDVNVTADLVWNVTKYFIIDPDSWLSDISYEVFDSANDGDTLDDSIKVNFTMNTVLPLEYVMLEVLYNTVGEDFEYKVVNYTVNSSGRQDSIVFPIPDDVDQGSYSVKLRLYNSTGRVNEIAEISDINYNDSSSSSTYYLYHPFGNPVKGNLYQNVNDRITGSVFTANENGIADNITAYINHAFMSPDPYQCMLYRKNDSKFIGNTSEDWTLRDDENNPHCSSGWAVFNFSEPKPNLSQGTQYVITCWGEDLYSWLYYDDFSDPRGRYNETNYTSEPPDYPVFTNENVLYSIYCSYTAVNFGPEITSINANPDPVGFGMDITISANVTDVDGVDTVKVNIVKPQDDPEQTASIYTMTNTAGDTYEYTFNDTWQNGQYNYTIWAVDNKGYSNTSSQYSFNVSGQATVSVCTILDEYGNNSFVNVTDPPSNPSEIGYELLDEGEVLRIWNRFDSYYFNTSSGVQFTNHYNEYWSHNVLMLGYYNNDEWNLIYRTDELNGFNKDIDSDDETYVNATLWKDLTYQGYDFRLAIRYHLGVDDNELTVIPYIKNIDDEDISYNLGFAWEINDIQVDMTPSGDYIEINGATYFLDGDLDETYKNMDSPCFYIREDISVDKSESLYLRWNKNLNYVVRVKSREGQHNAPVTLGIKIGALAVNQEKYTEMFWHDASEIVYYFNSYNAGEAWTTNPGYMVDGSMSNYASTTINGDVERCNGNNCSGTNLGDILIVELRVYGYYFGGQRDTILRPVFVVGDGLDYRHPTDSSPGWSLWFDITYDPGHGPTGWSWDEVKNLDCDVEAETDLGLFTLYCSKVEIRVTYIPNNNPVISDPVPADGSIGIGIAPMLNITVVDPDGDNMNITWLSNSSGSWQVFGINNSVGNGTYHQTMVNASVNGGWWYWKVNVTDGINSVESDVFGFYTGYESKIKNTGSTNISGYLLMQVHYFDGYMWIVATEAVDETSPRTIISGGVLSLDTIFNGKDHTAYLIAYFGNGTYRVYAAFRDPDGTVLVCDDESLMEDTYEFTVSES